MLVVPVKDLTLAPNIFDPENMVVDNDTYEILDLQFKNEKGDVVWTYSRTYLKDGKSTRGHSHDGQDEIYHFQMGRGVMQVGGSKDDMTGAAMYKVGTGSVVYVPAGKFHRVWNFERITPLVFDALFPNSAKRPAF